jgi:hypothetical protein
VTTIIAEIYDAFVAAGVADDKAKAAAKAVLPVEQTATKADIGELRQAVRADLAELKSELIRAMWIQAGVVIGALSFIVGMITAVTKGLGG